MTVQSAGTLRIGIVTQYFPPERANISFSVPRELAARGHQVRVVTGFPNYPDGRLFPGYRQRFGTTEIHEGIAVRRTPLWISHSRNPLGRIANYVSFGISALSATRFLRDADVVYVYATQMTAAIAPSTWCRLWGTPFVLHVQDLWPESITGSGMVGRRGARLIDAVLRPWLRHLYRLSAATIGISPSMTDALVDRGVPSSRAHTVFNWSPRAEQGADSPRATDAESERDGTRTRLMYAGNIGEMQDLETVMHALNLVRDVDGISLDVFGDGTAVARVRATADRLGLTNVTFYGRVDRTEIALHAAQADYQLVTLKSLPAFRMTIPSKFQASLSQGVPVITTVEGDLGDLVREHGIGYVASPGDPQALAEAFRAAAATERDERQAQRERAYRLSVDTMSLDAGISSIERILTTVARAPKQRGK